MTGVDPSVHVKMHEDGVHQRISGALRCPCCEAFNPVV